MKMEMIMSRMVMLDKMMVMAMISLPLCEREREGAKVYMIGTDQVRAEQESRGMESIINIFKTSQLNEWKIKYYEGAEKKKRKRKVRRKKKRNENRKNESLIECNRQDRHNLF